MNRIETKGKLQFKQNMRDAKVRQMPIYAYRLMGAFGTCHFFLQNCLG